ncbi:MAG TPA: hypothetical protein PLS98_08575 [Dictyoglomaceae bacterium]|nr:hypothetical protein [Dictyoglomaceae bacterium]
MAKEPVSISVRTQSALERLLRWDKLEEVNRMADQGLSAYTIAEWVRSQGVKMSTQSMETYLMLYQQSKETNTTVADLVAQYAGTNLLANVTSDIETLKLVKSVLSDVSTLDAIINEGSKNINNNALISAKDVINAIQTKDALLRNSREVFMKRLFKLDSMLERIIQIMVDEVPEEYLDRVMTRFQEEFGSDGINQ